MVVKVFLYILLGCLLVAGIVFPGLAHSEDEMTLFFESGREHKRFVEAQLAYQTLINSDPDPRYTPLCFLYIADSY